MVPGVTYVGGAAAALAAPDAARVRDELHELVLKDLLGPLAGEDEEFDEDPIERYPLGRLAPAGTMVDPAEQEVFGDLESSDETSDAPEPAAPNAPSLFPSSLGLTCRVDGSATAVTAQGSWGRYVRRETTEGLVWARVPTSGTVKIPLVEGPLPALQVHPEEHGVVVRGRARRYQGDWLVSLFLVNQQTRPVQRPAGAWLFQAELVLGGPDGLDDPVAVFKPRPDSDGGGDPSDRAEQRRLAMGYRFSPEFAVGHATGVVAVQAPDDPMRSVSIRTAVVPSFEVPATDVPRVETDPDLPELAGVELDMQVLGELADGPAELLAAALRPLVDGYRAWIARNTTAIDNPSSHLAPYRADALAALARASLAAGRIEQGIQVLIADAEARAAFGFANRAMHLQRIHTLATAERQGARNRLLGEVLAEIDVPKNRSWRPFQLAFFLLCLPSLADPEHPERSDDRAKAVADLLWFPTGGGKTEAYLGLTAFTLAVRRLQPMAGGLDPSSGVAVLMRYTLRLLTIQQFQRATALICACEELRRQDENRWGRGRFRIGLWVGGQVTPNRTDRAADWLKELKKTQGARSRGGGSPHQLTSCPWCGTAIDPGKNIDVNLAERRTRIRCADWDCPFGSINGDGEGLPVVLVDEEIYRLLPSLVIGTVDKFAQLPWRGETIALFGRVSRRCERHGYVSDDLAANDWEATSHQADPKTGAPAAKTVGTYSLRPPDLIIQDELHLISGPLGSLTGLYETAVDRLATWDNGSGQQIRPKVIASTATVRRAPRQIEALFYRHTEVFPPPGLNADDSFFARQRLTGTGPQAKPGRRYVGICAHGTRIRSTLIRVYVSVLGAAQLLHKKYGANEVTDPYMTLVGYFNSLRDLGGMRRIVEDDVSTRLTRAYERGLANRYDPILKELTSRMSSGDIPGVLEQLTVPFASGRRKSGDRWPIDVLLATNMISVGVDVPRLGVMVVAGQPKSTAEYIQATSRVGRAAPGLVFTVFNWARPRDLSHYETFDHFHATFYRHVEALSVTPFADRAIDRGLTGVLVALMRNLEPAYNANIRAHDVDRRAKLADHVVRFLKRRAAEVTGDNRVGDEVERALDARLDLWDKERRQPARRLVYEKPTRSDDLAGLLRRPDDGPWRMMTCPTSLRDVEPGIRLLLAPGADGPVEEPPFVPKPAGDDG